MASTGQEASTCAYPGCDNQARPGEAGAAVEPQYCGLPDPVSGKPHTALAAFRRRQELALQGGGVAEPEELRRPGIALWGPRRKRRQQAETEAQEAHAAALEADARLTEALAGRAAAEQASVATREAAQVQVAEAQRAAEERVAAAQRERDQAVSAARDRADDAESARPGRRAERGPGTAGCPVGPGGPRPCGPAAGPASRGCRAAASRAASDVRGAARGRRGRARQAAGSGRAGRGSAAACPRRPRTGHRASPSRTVQRYGGPPRAYSEDPPRSWHRARRPRPQGRSTQLKIFMMIRGGWASPLGAELAGIYSAPPGPRLAGAV